MPLLNDTTSKVMVAEEIKIVKGVAELVLIIKVEDNLIVAKKKKQVGVGRKKERTTIQ